MDSVLEWTAGQSRKLACVPVGERNHHSVRRDIAQAGQRISCEARLRLLPIGDNRRPVASIRAIVSLTASASADWSSAAEIRPSRYSFIAVNNRGKPRGCSQWVRLVSAFFALPLTLVPVCPLNSHASCVKRCVEGEAEHTRSETLAAITEKRYCVVATHPLGDGCVEAPRWT